MTEMIVEITQQQIQPCCHYCMSIVDDKRSWTNTDPDAPHPYCRNPQSPYYMRKPGGICYCYAESAQPASAGEGEKTNEQ
jgi:hypothetical protein